VILTVSETDIPFSECLLIEFENNEPENAKEKTRINSVSKSFFIRVLFNGFVIRRI
jgi:hypothetical protein